MPGLWAISRSTPTMAPNATAKIKHYIVTQNHNGVLETVQKEDVKNY
jgi:hypothetical protein